MRRLSFPAHLMRNADANPTDSGYTILFRDLPEAISFADGEGAARVRAADCLWTAIAGRVHAREPIPEPTPARAGEFAVEVEDLLAAKAALHLAMLASSLDDAALARRLNTSPVEVGRLLDPAHPTRLDRLTRALAIFRKRVVVDVLDAA